MKKEYNGTKEIILLIAKTSLWAVITTGIVMCIFAVAMYLLNLDNSLSSIFATLSIAIGSMIASYYAARKKETKGYITGFTEGFSTFIIITLLSLIADDGSITVNTVFRFVIIVLSAMIGGIMGVNKKEKKYI